MELDLVRNQRERIRRLVLLLNPTLTVEFYENRLSVYSTDVRFRVRDKATERIIASIPQDKEWALTELQDKSDAEVSGDIEALIGLRQPGAGRGKA